MSKGKSNSNKLVGKGSPGNFAPRLGRMLKLAAIAAALAAVILFNSVLITVTFETVGFGLFLWLLWLGAIALVVWGRKQRHLLSRWNLWLSALSFTLATWGILALFYPSGLFISTADIGEVSLGGRVGANFIGNQGVGAPPSLRLAILILSGVGLVTPRHGLRALKLSAQTARGMGKAAYSYTRRTVSRLGRRSVEIYRSYPIHLMLGSTIVTPLGRLRRRRVAIPEPEPEMSQEALTPEELLLTIRMEAQEEAVTVPEAEEPIDQPQPAVTEAWTLPGVELLDKITETEPALADNSQRARMLEEALISYGVEAKVVQINPGPSVTQFGVEPGWDRKYRRVVERDGNGNKEERVEEVSKTRVKVERIRSLENDLALALAAPSIRIEAPVPGKSLVGIEVPNTTTALVSLRAVIESTAFQKVKARSKLAIALGKGAAGEAVAADLAKMPHLLIAGATGSGKTVCINCIIACLLLHNRQEEVRLILIDPKRVELVSFNGVPHLIAPVVVEADKIIEALRRTVREMTTRFSKFAAIGVRNIEGYNRSPLVTEQMSYLVVIIDELADLMMTAAEVVEPLICRLAQLSRATGIHLIVATQRPSVDVVTGLIKANFPTRIAFAVASSVDSRTILDTGGAEKLLGRGDMLYVPPDADKPKRLRGCFISDQEIDRLVDFWKRQQGQASPLEDAVARAFTSLEGTEMIAEDSLLDAAKNLAKEHPQISTSFLQRRLHIGYPRAARLMDLLEEEGLIGPGEAGKTRVVLIPGEPEEKKEG